MCTFFDKYLAYVFARQSLHTVEYVLPEGKGYILSRMVPEFNESGEVVSVLVLSTDISERKWAEEALRESEARFRLMVDAVPVSIWITDAEGRTEYLKQHWCDYCGGSL